MERPIWICVRERLPTNGVPVLVNNGKWTGVGAYYADSDYLHLGELEHWQDEHREFIECLGPRVTHWMPLPPPPAESRTGEAVAS
jgi:hypothetical protein